MDDQTERITVILRQAAAVVEELSRGRQEEGLPVVTMAPDLRPAAFAVAAEMLAHPMIELTSVVGEAVRAGVPTIDLLDTEG